MDQEKRGLRAFFEDFGLLLLSITLFLGGGFILSLEIPFWSLVFGLASVQIGIVLIILTFDSFIRRKTAPITEDYKVLPCLTCRYPTYVPKYANNIICEHCQVKIARVFKGLTLVAFAFLTVSSAIYLVGQNQELREKAATKPRLLVCEQGIWEPDVCSCGSGAEYECPEGTLARTCKDEQVYCCKKDSPEDKWTCENPLP